MSSYSILSVAAGIVLAWARTAAVAEKHESSEPGVTIYLQSSPAVPVAVLARAELVTTKIFASIGVPIEWRRGAEHRSKGQVEVIIEMQLDSGAPADFHPGALAYALPYGTAGTRIHVFCDRVFGASSSELAGAYLGHTIAHEITHVLEGFSRHSDEGIMKAHWGVRDMNQMAFRPLPFAIEDADLIHRGLRQKQSR